MKLNATVSIETITPEQAELLLSNQVDDQRNKRPTYSSRLAMEMVENRWRLSADAIVLIKGKLANGQHRLTAVVESGMAQQFIVLRSDDEELYKVLDCGLRRTEADVISRIENATKIVSVARLVLRYDKRPKNGSALLVGYAIPRGDVVDYCEKNTDALQASVRYCQSLYSKKRILVVSVGATLHYILSRSWGGEKADAFIFAVYDGTAGGDAAFDFRERLVKNSIAKAKLRADDILAIGIKAANLWIKGRTSGVLKFAETESYPSVHAA